MECFQKRYITQVPHVQVDGEIVTIEVPEVVKKQFASDDFQQWHEEFLVRHPLAKTLQGKKPKKDTKNPAKPRHPKRAAPKDFSKCLVAVDSLPAEELQCEVAIVNSRASGKLSTMPLLCVGGKTGIFVKNQSGYEVPRSACISSFGIICPRLGLLFFSGGHHLGKKG